MQNQFVGSTYRMYDNKHQAAILFSHDFAQALRTEWEIEPDTKVTLNTVSSVHGIWWLKKQVRHPNVKSQALIRVQVLEEAKRRNEVRSRVLMAGTNNCRILSHRSDCTIAENPNEHEFQEASQNAALEKQYRAPGSLKLEYKKVVWQNTVRVYGHTYIYCAIRTTHKMYQCNKYYTIT